MALTREETIAQLNSASVAFDHLFSNRLPQAKDAFAAEGTPFHLMGLGVCSFLEAALGMEMNLMAEAKKTLNAAEAATRKQLKAAQKNGKSATRFSPGMEWDVLHADSVILAGLVNALSESYMGYLQCLYALNSANSRFTKLYKIVFPNGLDSYPTPNPSRAPSRQPSIQSLTAATPSTPKTPSIIGKSGFFGRFGALSLAPPSAPKAETTGNPEDDGPIEEAIVSGVAFGYGLFNLVFSLLPTSVKQVVGWLGFSHDRRLALRALAVSAEKSDVHSVFASLSLMTYHGVVLLLSGYQADEQHILRQYRAIINKMSSRYPTGSLWVLNQAKILRMSHDAEGAIRVLQEGLGPDRPHLFKQADALLVFELAWTLLAQRRYADAAKMFIRMTEVNQWSQATYYYIAAGCHVSLKDYDSAQKLFDSIPALLDKKKLGGKDLPTEVLIRKKVAFYKEKQKRRGGSESRYAECIAISPAEELGLFWNTHQRVDRNIAEAHVEEWFSLTPPVALPVPLPTPSTLSSTSSVSTPQSSTPGTPLSTSAPLTPSTSTLPSRVDLDTPDEIALRHLLLGIVYRTLHQFSLSRAHLLEARKLHPKVTISTWIGGVAVFELAVMELKEAEAVERGHTSVSTSSLATLASDTQSNADVGNSKNPRELWTPVLKSANVRLDEALSLAPNSVDLSSRLESRIAMLRDEITLKREMLGL